MDIQHVEAEFIKGINPPVRTGYGFLEPLRIMSIAKARRPLWKALLPGQRLSPVPFEDGPGLDHPMASRSRALWGDPNMDGFSNGKIP